MESLLSSGAGSLLEVWVERTAACGPIVDQLIDPAAVGHWPFVAPHGGHSPVLTAPAPLEATLYHPTL